jgi:hypothetical protein
VNCLQFFCLLSALMVRQRVPLWEAGVHVPCVLRSPCRACKARVRVLGVRMAAATDQWSVCRCMLAWVSRLGHECCRCRPNSGAVCVDAHMPPTIIISWQLIL